MISCHSSTTSIKFLRSDNVLNVIQSDSDISESKINFDGNHLKLNCIKTTGIRDFNRYQFKPSKYGSKYLHTDAGKHCHSEVSLTKSEDASYDCFYLFDDNNDEQPHMDMDIDEHEHTNQTTVKQYEIVNTHTIEEQNNSFDLFNDYIDSDEENIDGHEIMNKPTGTYSMNVPSIKIPQTSKELIKPIQPAVILHLERIGCGRNVRRRVLKELIQKKMKRKHHKKEKHKHKVRKMRNIEKAKQIKSRLKNMLNYFVFDDRYDLILTLLLSIIQ